MKVATLKLYSLDYGNVKTYLAALIFTVGNIILPQLCHLIPDGGKMLLPIYFFTLIGAYKYGWKVGVLTAVFSPVVNYLLFGMPGTAILPAILLKSVLLAVAAGMAAAYFKRISVLILVGVVLTYQILGGLGEWLLTGSFNLAVQDFRLAIPGMLIQVFGGYLFVKYLIGN
jgi:hypothetical protein